MRHVIVVGCSQSIEGGSGLPKPKHHKRTVGIVIRHVAKSEIHSRVCEGSKSKIEPAICVSHYGGGFDC